MVKKVLYGPKRERKEDLLLRRDDDFEDFEDDFDIDDNDGDWEDFEE